MAKRPASPRCTARSTSALKFDKRLILSQWMLHLFEVETFEALADRLRDPGLEGFTPDNITKFHDALTMQIFQRGELSKDLLLGYDQNIVRHWRQISERRAGGTALYPKYFQYLSLLFTEIYLDRWFRSREKLLEDLNAFLSTHNATMGDSIAEYTVEDLKKLAFWSATGSGKTLLMHVNILQFRQYLAANGRERDLNRIILLTPNEGLSRQHLEEFKSSGLSAEIFSKDGGSIFTGRSIEIIEITKLVEEGKKKTVSVEAFETDNLVLVDEGHKGAAGEKWKPIRDMLSENGFSFEYSATFGQAVSAAPQNRRRELTEEYAKCILFDYSYKYFYGDGYGKDYRILNLADDDDENVRGSYLTACVLAFYQQAKLYRDRGGDFRRFLIERPLWVFVGGSVNAVRTENKRQVSDVVDILLFLAELIRNDGGQSVRRIDNVLNGRAGLRDNKGKEIFAHTFLYLIEQKMTAGQIFADLLLLIFNASGAGRLHVANLKGADGELSLGVGENEPFGVINVGDATSLWKLCEAREELIADESEFTGSYFRTIDSAGTTINLLIGSKKFSEGWNSWRVSTMGLMNIGKSEGSEIIQLFGRGVRLKGIGFGLKRSRHAVGSVNTPKHITTLETLNIFGIRADYMKQFKEYLEEEGLPSNENRIEFVLPVVTNLGSRKLKVLKLKDGIDYKRTGPKPTLGSAPGSVPIVTLDWYPKIQAEVSKGIKVASDVVNRHEGELTAGHTAFFDMEAIYFELQRFKNERGWFNLNLTRQGIHDLLARSDWYRLYIPKAELEYTTFAQVARWQEIAITLLKKYCDYFYKQQKKGYEVQFMEYSALDAGDPNFVAEYRFLIEESREDILEKLAQLAADIKKGTFKDVEFSGLASIAFGQHLYQPLIHLKSDLMEVAPVALNEGERDFVMNLKTYFDNSREFFAGRELYLLRNQSRGRGIGFFEAGNFYPDFILWILDEKNQYVTFVDPKGLRNLSGFKDPKIDFHKTIKELEERLDDQKVILNSFIISNTPFSEIAWWDEVLSVADVEELHVLFQKEDESGYIGKMMRRIMGALQ